MTSTQHGQGGGDEGKEGGGDERWKKPALQETDTDDLKRFREKWLRELKPVPQTSQSDDNQTPADSSLSSSVHSSDEVKQNVAYHRHVTGENKLITKFMALLELEENEENEHEKDGKTNNNNNNNNDMNGEEQKRNRIFILPSELQLAILSNLDVKSLEYVSVVCRFWYILARDEVLPQFQKLCLRTWSGITTQMFESYQCNWRNMYLYRPRLRDDGIYISRNYYLRPGQTEGSYYQPVHEVVYYRYLRFFTNGSVIYTLSSDVPKQTLTWFKPSLASSSSSSSLRSVHSGSYIMEEGRVQVWMRISQHHTTCLQLSITSSKVGRNDRLTLEEYKCVHANNEEDQIDVQIKKFHFVKLPKHYLADDFVVPPELH